jgi:vancomycin resistance protein VanW
MHLLQPTDPTRQALSAWGRRSLRQWQDRVGKILFAGTRAMETLPFPVLSEQSPLRRPLPGIDPQLFENKRTNLQLAIEPLDGILIHPDETFSFWRLVGAPVRSRGYLDGLTISGGVPGRGPGGGLCQLSNAIFWLALHSDLQVTERHRPSFDIFPDRDRTIPFGTGATVVYNYKDLRLFNPTGRTYQFRFSLTDTMLSSSLACSDRVDHRYQLGERNARIERLTDGYVRSNEIVREKRSSTGELVEERVIFRNQCRCRYNPMEVLS